MSAEHDVKDLGMAAVKLPDGQELKLPLLQVIAKLFTSVLCVRTVAPFIRDNNLCRTQRGTGFWMFESCNQRKFSDLSVTGSSPHQPRSRCHNTNVFRADKYVVIDELRFAGLGFARLIPDSPVQVDACPAGMVWVPRVGLMLSCTQDLVTPGSHSLMARRACSCTEGELRARQTTVSELLLTICWTVRCQVQH